MILVHQLEHQLVNQAVNPVVNRELNQVPVISRQTVVRHVPVRTVNQVQRFGPPVGPVLVTNDTLVLVACQGVNQLVHQASNQVYQWANQ